MVRLMILLGPISSVVSAAGLSFLFNWIYSQLFLLDFENKNDSSSNSNTKGEKLRDNNKQKKSAKNETSEFSEIFLEVRKIYSDNKSFRFYLALILFVLLLRSLSSFYSYSVTMAKHSSHPSIMYKAKNVKNEVVLVDDYREAYFWLKKNTDYNARVLSWWDYGYQISGIADRITLADGNTWNHEHIATIGKMLVSPEYNAHLMVRHLADYVLVWTGGGGDDLAKSPHIARIANSVFNSICGLDDPLCHSFGFVDRDRQKPTESMRQSLVFKLHSAGIFPGVSVNSSLFENVFTSVHGKVRIWKVLNIDTESRDWTFDENNYVCDTNPKTSWICKGSYPPKFREFISDRKNFAQLEDFNKKKEGERAKEAEEYQKKYHEAFSKRT